MTEWVYRCMIVLDGQVEFARALAAAIAGSSGAGMWTAPLAGADDAPPTQWVSAGLISAQFAGIMPLTEFDADGQPVTTPGRAALAARLATAAGMDATEAQVQALFDASDVTSEDAQVALARLELVLTTGAAE